MPRGSGNIIADIATREKTQDSSRWNTKEETSWPLLFVIRLGLEPKTPTLKVLCSTN